MSSPSGSDASDNTFDDSLWNFVNMYAKDDQTGNNADILLKVPNVLSTILKDAMCTMDNLQGIANFVKNHQDMLDESPEVAGQMKSSIEKLDNVIKKIGTSSDRVCDVTINMMFWEQENGTVSAKDFEQTEAMDVLLSAHSEYSNKATGFTKSLKNAIKVIDDDLESSSVDTDSDTSSESSWEQISENEDDITLLDFQLLNFDE